MVGFSLWHMHPFFAMLGLLSFYSIIAWSLAAIVFTVRRRNRVTPFEVAMFSVSALVIAGMLLPDTFFVHRRITVVTSPLHKQSPEELPHSTCKR